MEPVRIYECYSDADFVSPSSLSTTAKELGVDFAVSEVGGRDVKADGVIVCNKDETAIVTFSVNGRGGYPLAPGESFHLPVQVRTLVVVASEACTADPIVCLLSR